MKTSLKELVNHQGVSSWEDVKEMNGAELTALLKVLEKVKALKASKIDEYGTACNMPDSCTTKAKKLAYLLGDCLDRVRVME